MYALYACSQGALAADSKLFATHFEPLLAQLQRAVTSGEVKHAVPEVEQYLAVCRWPFRQLEYSFALEAVLDRVGPGSKVLDAGAGVTPLGYIAARHGATTSACDVDANLIAWLQQGQLGRIYQADVSYSRQDLTALAYADNAFDVVTCISVLEHIPAPHDSQAMRELMRVLKPGGLLVVTVDYQQPSPNGNSSSWQYYVRRGRTLARSGEWRQLAGAVSRKRQTQRDVRRSAITHARSANQCFGVQHIDDDLLPLIATWSSRQSQLASAVDFKTVTTADARNLWDLQTGLFALQGGRYVLPAAICV